MSRDTAKFRIQSWLLSVLIIGLAIGLSSCGSSEKKDSVNEKADLYYAHGTSQLIKQEYTAALDSLTKAYELKPKDSKVANNLGMAYYFKGDQVKALEYLNKSLDLDKTNSDARNNLASVYLQQGNLKLAKEHYEEITKDLVYQHQFRVYYNLSLIAIRQNEEEEAQRYLQLAIKEKHDYCPAHYQLGLLQNKLMQMEAALKSFQEASQGPCYDEPAPHFQQAMLLIRLQKTEQARTKLKDMAKKYEGLPYGTLANQELGKLNQNMEVSSQQETEEQKYDIDEAELRQKLEKIENSKI